MRKSLIFVALGAVALGACTKTAVSYEPTSEISFAPVARKNMSKGTAIASSTFPENWNLKVFGYYDKDVEVGKQYAEGKFTEQYLPGVEFAKNARGNSGYWLGKEHAYYWPKTGSILFAAYAPADYKTATVAHDEATNTFSVSKFEQPTDLSKTVDLLYSPYTTSVNNTVVHMQFQHALSWVTIKAQAEAESTVKLKSIVLKGLAAKAESAALPAWTVEETKNITIYSVEDGTLVTKDLTEYAAAVESGLFFPQALLEGAKLEVTYSMNKGDGTYVDQAPFEVVLKTLKSGDTTIDKWEAGKHYFYNITFGDVNEIQIAPTVKEWEEVTADNISATKGGGDE